MSFKPNLISVIVTCYNQGRFLAESLDSLLAQSHENWECIIIDDGSTDHTQQIASDYVLNDKRFSYYAQKNKGVSPARNLGLEKAKGNLIQFLDADDQLHKDKFTTQIAILNNNSNIDVIYGSSRYFLDGYPDVLYPFHTGGSIPCDLTYRDAFQVEMLLKHNICTNCSALYRRDKLLTLRFKDVIFEDWVFNLECALKGMNFHFDNSFSSYSYIRITPTSQMRRHTLQVDAVRKFRSLLMGLVKEYKYSISDMLMVDEEKHSDNKLIEAVRAVTPPFIFSIGAALRRKLIS